jgi:hypothetical protein
MRANVLQSRDAVLEQPNRLVLIKCVPLAGDTEKRKEESPSVDT